MKKISTFIVKARYWLLGIFVALIGISCFLMTQVNINYNLMEYLDKGSTSTVALTTMEDEYGSVGQCQVMITHITYEEATGLKGELEEVKGVSAVIFASSEADTQYFIKLEGAENGTALFKVFLTTGNFDTASYNTLDRIRDVCDDYTIAMNGGSVTSQYLTNSLDRDMKIILAVVVVVVLLILMCSSTSFVEPFLFLIVAGSAILINMGTNILLNYIPYIGNSMSFITKSIAAVMQLALSMDYAIVLLHAYREEKEKTEKKTEAMANALSRSFSPVSASSITTIAGLVALMFMSFSIGFDIGLVLAKGILISLLSVFLLMPSLLLILDKLIEKTAHQPLDKLVHSKIQAHNEKKAKAGRKVYTISSYQKKTRIIVPVLAVIIVVIGAIFNFRSEYSFTLQASTDKNASVNVDDKEISNTFGTQNTLVVLVSKDGKTMDELGVIEGEIVNYMKAYEYEGKKVINSVQGFSSYGAYTKMPASTFASVYGISEAVVSQVYASADETYMTPYEVLTYVVTNKFASTQFGLVQQQLNLKYQGLVEAGLFDATTGAVNNDVLAQINQYIQGYEAGVIDNTNETNQATYANYKTLTANLDKTAMMTSYPFINSDTADLILNGNPAIPNYYVIQASVAKEIAKQYGNAMQAAIEEKASQFTMFESENYIRIIFNLDMEVSSDESFEVINDMTDHLYGMENCKVKVVCETFVYSQIKDVFNKDIVTVNLISFIAILLIIALTFRSCFVPVLLTVLIQGAIWVTMGASTIMGNDIFFVCYIVVMCVQMGATIDYGILLTNNYTENRKTMGKMDAMSKAVFSSITTILTSGSILVLATLIIGLVSKVSIISDLGLLLSRGCLISVIMIIFVLPQCLMLCDKLIEKSTFRTKFYNGEDGLAVSGEAVEKEVVEAEVVEENSTEE